jgi:hypothetical protein
MELKEKILFSERHRVYIDWKVEIPGFIYS